MKIVVTRALPEATLAPLTHLGDLTVCGHDRPLTTPELIEAVRGADAVVSMLTDRIDAEVLTSAGQQLQVVANTAVGYDNIDTAAITQHGCVATNTPGVLVDATADLALGLLLDITRRVSEGDRLIRSGQHWSWDIGFMLGMGLQDRQLGIVGMGHIGRAVARRAAAFGMRIVYHARREHDGDIGVRMPLEELLDTSDVVSLHCPLTAQTRHLIGSAALQRMKSGAYLINTARGPVVDENALADALAGGVIAGAALDVYEDEPQVHPRLLGLDNVVLAPHLGSATVQTRTRMAELAVENVVSVLHGAGPITPIPGTVAVT
ncbi:MAG: glyoxylate reductase [Mycobacterium sp.]|nr:glyoxylate reductase [Mycobacterium sp.]